MKEVLIIEVLSSFFLLLKARIEKYTLLDNRVLGTVFWENEDDKQDFLLTIESLDCFPNIKLICDYLRNYNLVNGDRIQVSEIDLIRQLLDSGWLERDAKEAIDCLCSFGIRMVDNGEETDLFFIHF